MAYGAERLDTLTVCGDANNGFILLINYNSLEDGTHTVRMFDNGIEFASRTFTVVTPGEEFLVGASASTMAIDFPGPGQATILEWNQATQGFEIVGIIGLPE